jgi:hypothetical protein
MRSCTDLEHDKAVALVAPTYDTFILRTFQHSSATISSWCAACFPRRPNLTCTACEPKCTVLVGTLCEVGARAIADAGGRLTKSLELLELPPPELPSILTSRPTKSSPRLRASRARPGEQGGDGYRQSGPDLVLEQRPWRDVVNAGCIWLSRRAHVETGDLMLVPGRADDEMSKELRIASRFSRWNVLPASGPEWSRLRDANLSAYDGRS